MIPEGMRDVLPGEAAELYAVEAVLRTRFAAYGYGEVRTPTLEFAETLELAADDTLGGGYRLFDDQGRELMLRTDMTVPVARLAAARCRDKPLPLRLFYVGGSFRPWAPQRSQDGEFLQAGIELLGEATAEADAECVALLCDALESCGLPEYRVTLNTMAFPTALVDTLGLEADDSEALLEALGRPRLPAARDDRVQRLRRRRGAQGAAGDAGSGRHARQPRPGAQARDDAGHGGRHRAPREGARPGRPRRGTRTPSPSTSDSSRTWTTTPA